MEAACNPGGPCNSCASGCGGASETGPFGSALDSRLGTAASTVAAGVFGWSRLTPERLERARLEHRVLPRRVGLHLIAAYRRWLSPRVTVMCRFTPSCSGYGYRAVSRYGLWVGSRLAAARVFRCRPGVTPGTHDPVPGTGEGR